MIPSSAVAMALADGSLGAKIYCFKDCIHLISAV